MCGGGLSMLHSVSSSLLLLSNQEAGSEGACAGDDLS